MNISEEKY